MDKITKKLIAYFLGIIASVVLISFILSSVFLTKFYVKQQYKNLQNEAQNVYESIKAGYKNVSANAILVSGNNIVFIGNNRGARLGFWRRINIDKLPTIGKIKNPMGDNMLYYKLKTDRGYIITFESSRNVNEYMKIVYIVLILVFLLSIILSIPIISIIGKKFTKPVLKLKYASKEIANGNFDVDTYVDTKDEIQDLSMSIKTMAYELDKKYSFQRSFIANVSHDFRTPLSIIRNYSEAIYDDIIDEVTKKDYLRDIISEVDRLNLLVNDILQLSKLKEGVYKFNPVKFNIKDLLEECKNKFESIALQRNIKINLSSESIYIEADYNLLSRVLYNFIDNAIKFSKNNSEVQIIAEFQDSKLKVLIKDYGQGIKKEMLDSIWDRYYKHRESGGMGLGLVICKEILELHNFQYGVNSIENSGSEFYFITDYYK